MGFILHCFNCLHRETTAKPFPDSAAKCPECGAKMDYAGPLWLGNIFDAQFIESMIDENAQRAFRNSSKITKLLSPNQTKKQTRPSTYYVLDKLSGKFGLPAPAVAPFCKPFDERVSRRSPTHFNSRGIRTDAPASAHAKNTRKVWFNRRFRQLRRADFLR